MNTISIIIPIYNRIDITKQGLKSLNSSLYNCKPASNNFNFEIIVIDDGSTDGSGVWIKQNYPNIHLITGDGNLWWSGSINMGAKYAINTLSADYILLWNDDVITDEKYFSKL